MAVRMGHRSRRCGDYLLMLQKPPLRAKTTWRYHSIRDRWVEKRRYPNCDPHIKPAGSRSADCIAAVTALGASASSSGRSQLSRRCMSRDELVAALSAAISAQTAPPNERASPPRVLRSLPATRRNLSVRARRRLSDRAARRRQGRCRAHGARRADPRRAPPARPCHRAEARRHDRVAGRRSRPGRTLRIFASPFSTAAPSAGGRSSPPLPSAR